MRRTSATVQSSVQNAKKRLQTFLKDLDTIPSDILHEEAPQLYAEILSEVPYKTGKLERSVRVSVSRDARRPGLHASASAHSSQGYDYAGIQHENTKFYHPIKGKAHFISDPFERATKRIIRKMRKRLKLSRR